MFSLVQLIDGNQKRWLSHRASPSPFYLMLFKRTKWSRFHFWSFAVRLSDTKTLTTEYLVKNHQSD